MPRLRSRNGSVVNVSDEMAARLGGYWESLDEPKAAEKAAEKPAKKAPAKHTSK